MNTLTRNWISYLTDSLVNSGTMQTWEAADYLSQNLFGESPNTRFHETKAPYEAIHQFLMRVYHPILEAAGRDSDVSEQQHLTIFCEISLVSKSTVLVVSCPEEEREHRLLLLDPVCAWDLLFPAADAFNAWAEERCQRILEALKPATISGVQKQRRQTFKDV